jgi:hypothetical protein
MKYFFPAVAAMLLLSQPEALGQNSASQTVRATNTLMRIGSGNSFSPTDMIQMMPSSSVSTVDGNPYWDERWGASSVLLYDKPTPNDGWYTRYDIRSDEFEFLVNKQIKVAKGSVIKNVVWVDSLTQKTRFLVNAKDYKLDGVPLLGFIEVLVDGDQQLIKRIELQVLKPNYNEAMSTGSKNSKITKKELFYYSDNGELFEIKSRKSLAPLFGEQSEQMSSFIKEEKLKTGRESDLVRIFEHLATLRPVSN